MKRLKASTEMGYAASKHIVFHVSFYVEEGKGGEGGERDLPYGYCNRSNPLRLSGD